MWNNPSQTSSTMESVVVIVHFLSAPEFMQSIVIPMLQKEFNWIKTTRWII
jgi:hypothetical protein